jgi:hypothetical protein
MGFLQWVSENWFILLQSLGIIGGLVFTALSLQLDAKARRIGNLMAITKNHREIWRDLYDRPELARVLEGNLDSNQTAVTRKEEWFIRFLIAHLNTVYHALKSGVVISLEGLEKDIRWFFSLPLPKAVWEKMKPMQDKSFVEYVERCRMENP